jgi:hypothetical protein
MGRSGGGAKWTFANGALQLKINLHFTGSRAFKIVYQLEGESEKTVNISTISKGTYCEWDVLGEAGLTEAEALKLKSIQLTNSSSGGECRIYDMYIRVPEDETGVNNINANENANLNATPAKVVVNGRIAIIKNGVRYDLMGREF